MKITHNFIERGDSRSSEKADFKNIRKVIALKNRADDIISIKIYARNVKMFIHGFENMDSLLLSIRSKIDNDILTVEKRKLSDSVTSFIGIAAITGLFFILFWARISLKEAYGIFTQLFLFIGGIIFLTFKPVSKSSGIRFRKPEIIAGTLMTVGGVIVLLNATYSIVTN